MRKKIEKNQLKFLLILLAVIILLLMAYRIESNHRNASVKSPEQTPTKKTVDDIYKEMNDFLSVPYCTRKDPFKMEPEFSRSLSKIKQVFKNKEKLKLFNLVFDNFNCLDISYASPDDDMFGADGFFYFTKEYSGPEKLKILVSADYQSQDDILNSILLSHELTHVMQFILAEKYEQKINQCYNSEPEGLCHEVESKIKPFWVNDCVGYEVQAFKAQLIFFASLKPVEIDTLYLRAKEGLSNKKHKPALNYVLIQNDLFKRCQADDYYELCTENYFRNLIENDDFYKHQCNLN